MRLDCRFGRFGGPDCAAYNRDRAASGAIGDKPTHPFGRWSIGAVLVRTRGRRAEGSILATLEALTPWI